MFQIRFQIHSHAAYQWRFTISLETDIQTAYEEQEAVETAAREIEDRAGNLLDQRDELIQQRIWLQNELDNVGAG